MEASATILDWISVVGPLVFSWPFVILMAALYFRQPLLKLLENVAATNINKAKIGPVELQEDQVQTQQLQFLITCLVTDPELAHLNQLNGADPVLYEKTTFLIAELQRLWSLALIQVEGALEDLPAKGDLKDFVHITERGKQYLDIRQEVTQPET